MKLKSGSRSKWRINVDQIRLAGELGQERGQNVLLVTPDEAVAPLRIIAGRRQFEGALALLGALVHGLNGLKWQLDSNWRTLVAMLVVLTIPDKFGHGGLNWRGRRTFITQASTQVAKLR